MIALFATESLSPGANFNETSSSESSIALDQGSVPFSLFHLLVWAHICADPTCAWHVVCHLPDSFVHVWPQTALCMPLTSAFTTGDSCAIPQPVSRSHIHWHNSLLSISFCKIEYLPGGYVCYLFYACSNINLYSTQVRFDMLCTTPCVCSPTKN